VKRTPPPARDGRSRSGYRPCEHSRWRALSPVTPTSPTFPTARWAPRPPKQTVAALDPLHQGGPVTEGAASRQAAQDILLYGEQGGGRGTRWQTRAKARIGRMSGLGTHANFLHIICVGKPLLGYSVKCLGRTLDDRQPGKALTDGGAAPGGLVGVRVCRHTNEQEEHKTTTLQWGEAWRWGGRRAEAHFKAPHEEVAACRSYLDGVVPVTQQCRHTTTTRLLSVRL